MDEKDIQTYSATLAVEGAKKTAELGKDVADDVIRPTSKSIGNNLGKLADGVFGWLGVWGEKQVLKQQQYLKEFKESISSGIEQIPEENLKEPIVYIVGPAIEASKYYFEEDYIRTMFTKLITGSCDNRFSNTISPYFVDAIRQMNRQDAKVLASFKDEIKQAIVNYRYVLKNGGGKTDCYNYVFYLGVPKEIPETNSSSIVNLERLGFISIDFSNHFIADTEYQKYINDPTYIAIKKSIKDNFHSNQNSPFEDLTMDKGIVTLTPLGRNFVNICL